MILYKSKDNCGETVTVDSAAHLFRENGIKENMSSFHALIGSHEIRANKLYRMRYRIIDSLMEVFHNNIKVEGLIKDYCINERGVLVASQYYKVKNT